ncbi:HAD family hydrolase [Tepidicaulis sp. LMO-SS28]|uniref:HAD family hydrolase n=1 Tax=Tepidicaulis sp. LMO-SS28 TaxID=3447455 RepID=UPI003EDEB0FD
MTKTSASYPSLVIFDCDGVLVDTERVANELLVRLLGHEGLIIPYAECRKRFVGRSLESVQEEVEAELGRALAENWCEAVVRKETLHAFEAGIAAIPHVRDQIEWLKGLPLPHCVASSGKIAKMQATLGSSGLLPLLEDVLFSADMVGKGKPAPDLFLYAAAQMGHKPEECIVIEDSVPGVQAGRAAGMRVLGYAGDPHTDAEGLKREGAHIFDDMRALPGLLKL